MSSDAGFELRVGGRVWLDGQGWEVAELTGSTVRLTADGRLRTVSVTSLLGNDQIGEEEVQATGSEDLWTVPAVVLAGLTTRQQDVLGQKLRALRALMEPEHGDDRSVSERYEAAAAELGVTRRTLERQLVRLKEHGPLVWSMSGSCVRSDAPLIRAGTASVERFLPRTRTGRTRRCSR